MLNFSGWGGNERTTHSQSEFLALPTQQNFQKQKNTHEYFSQKSKKFFFTEEIFQRTHTVVDSFWLGSPPQIFSTFPLPFNYTFSKYFFKLFTWIWLQKPIKITIFWTVWRIHFTPKPEQKKWLTKHKNELISNWLIWIESEHLRRPLTHNKKKHVQKCRTSYFCLWFRVCSTLFGRVTTLCCSNLREI